MSQPASAKHAAGLRWAQKPPKHLKQCCTLRQTPLWVCNSSFVPAAIVRSTGGSNSTMTVDSDIVSTTLPACRRGVLAGMLGTAAVSLSSEAVNAAQAPAATADVPQQPLPVTSACNDAAEGCSGTASGAASTSSSSSNGSCSLTGAAAARDPTINSGCATPAAVRQQRGLSCFLPSRQVDLQVEVLRAKAALAQCSTDFEKHRLLVTLREINQAAFFSLLQQDVEGLLPLVYTPTIGDACLAWGSLTPRPTGLYITEANRGQMQQVLRQWPSDEVHIAVVTDGERILGLGDLGAHGMGIPTGKCNVYGAAGLPPAWLLPITVDVGTNNTQLQQDPLYVGLPQQRLRGPAYFDLMMELVEALQSRFQRRVLVHWEDLAAKNAFPVLKLVDAVGGIPTFNDDIQATAAVSLAAMLGGLQIFGVPPLTQQRWLFFGAGQANLGIARLLTKALQRQGVSPAQARSSIWMMDSKGLILTSRKGLSPEKAEFAQDASNLPSRDFAASAALGLTSSNNGSADGMSSRNGISSSSSTGICSSARTGIAVADVAVVVSAVQPTALIGAAAVPRAFGKAVIEALLQSTAATAGPSARPLVLALSNPTSKAEVSYADAMAWSQDKVVYASGSPFPPLARPISKPIGANIGAGRYGSIRRGSNKLLQPAQANNCFVFPGLSLGVLQSGSSAVTDDLLLAAAQAIAGMVGPEELEVECVLPRIGRLQQVTQAVAAAVVEAAGVEGLAAGPYTKVQQLQVA